MAREPTEMELRVLAEISEFHSGDGKQGMKIVRAAIRAMQQPTEKMIEAGFDEDGGRYITWVRMIDAASPPEDE